MKEVIKELNNLKILQRSSDYQEDLPEEYYEKYFQNLIQAGLDVDKHRWYETSVDVYEWEGEYFGIKHISDQYSESSSIVDHYHTLCFMEMEQKVIITFIKKR